MGDCPRAGGEKGALIGVDLSTMMGAVMMCEVLSEGAWSDGGLSSLSESVSVLEMVVLDRVDRLLDEIESHFSLFLSSSIMVIVLHRCLFVDERANKLCLVVHDGGT